MATTTMTLPALHDVPIRHEDTPLTLSEFFFETLADVVAPKNCQSTDHFVALSVGSRTGLVEALLNDTLKARTCGKEPRIAVKGVEVLSNQPQPGANKYLSDKSIDKNHGPGEVSSRLRDPDVSALLFVYPRQPDIVAPYIKGVAESELNIRTVVWLGQCDEWSKYESCFTGYYGWKHVLQVYPGEEIGLSPNEIMAVWRK